MNKIDAVLCRRAWEMILPAIEQIGFDANTLDVDGVIVVEDPRLWPHEALPVRESELFVARVKDDNEHGEPNAWMYRTARSAAEETLRTRLPLSELAALNSHLLATPGLASSAAGTAIDNGLVVSFCGLPPEFSELVAKMMAAAIIALCRMASLVSADDLPRP